ncbi:MAG TPA: sensor histidine kinase [Puia sp.]|nr:sensor histidine kinase [Puia sp.]
MKRVGLHLAFWTVYLCEDSALIYSLNTSRFPHLSDRTNLLLAIANAGIMLLPKLFFTYFILYVTLEAILRKEGRIVHLITYSFLALVAALLLYRVLSIYLIGPWLYGWPKESGNMRPFLDMLAFLVALMDIGFVSGMAVFIKQVRLQLAAKELEKNLLHEKLETELKYLRNQTHPHFLFNTLNNIYALARKKSDDTPGVVMKLSKLLRFMLYETRKPSVRIEEEVRMLDDYIELERIRYGTRLSFRFCRDIEDEAQPVSPLLLLPLVENAFKHGAGESRLASHIHIDLRLRDDLLHFRVENSCEDTGSGNHRENIGLGNIRRQLELIYEEYDLHIENEPSLFTVTLKINLNSHAKIQLPDRGR